MQRDMFYTQIVGIIFSTTTRKVLIGKTPGDKNHSFIEGELTHNEGMDACLKRTVKEKTGFTVHNLGAVYVENMLQDKEKIKVHFLCEIYDGELENGENVEDLIWVRPSQVEEKLGVTLPPRLHEYLLNLE